MSKLSRPELTLTATASRIYIPVVTSFAETSATAFGLGSEESLALTLATEEVTAYLSRVGAPDRPVQIVAQGGGYYTRLELTFEPREFDMRAFNLSASASFEDETSLNETALLIASRMVDRFSFSQEGAALRVRLEKEKAYPEPTAMPVSDVTALEDYSIRAPEAEELKTLAHRVTDRYESYQYPSTFTLPGKVVDMASVGEYRAAVAADSRGNMGGGIIWQFLSDRIVEFYGPYVLSERMQSEIANDLIDFCISALGRSGARGLISPFPTEHLPVSFFEPLGSLTVKTGQGELLDVLGYYRHLDEDLGATVRIHPDLHDFVEKEYTRLALPRDVREVVREGEMHSPFSVIAAEFDKGRDTVTLHPVWWGEDAEETVRADVEILTAEDISGIFFIMDLGKPWQTLFTPALQASGFEPRVLLPYGGKSDLILFQLRTGERSP